jgi:parvulin-like peptidyl-prolyl isomerase
MFIFQDTEFVHNHKLILKEGSEKVFRSILLIFLLIFFIFSLTHLGSCQPPKTEKDYLSEERLLAKVNEEPVTLKRFYDFLENNHILSSRDPEEDQKKKEVALHDLLKEILIDQKALSLNLESDSSFIKQKNQHMNDFLLNYLHTKGISEKIEVTDEEIKEYYEQHKDEYYALPEKREIRQLLIKVKRDATQEDFEKSLEMAEREAEEKIEALYKRVKAGEDFADLVRQYSEDASRTDITGNMGYVEKGKLSPQFDSVAFSLKVGEISGPVRDKRGYHLISVLDIKKKEYREFNERVIRGIRRFLEEEKVKEKTKEYVKQLKEKTKFVYRDEILNLPDSLVNENDWLLIINDQDTIKFKEYAPRISWYKLNMGKDSLTLEDKKDLLGNFLAVQTILLREAERRGYRDSIDYQVEERSFVLDEARQRVEMEKEKKDFPPPTREELEAYYQAHKIDYAPLGMPIHVYHIIFDDSLKAVEVLNQIRNGADFVELAKKYYPGEAEIKDVAYDLGFISQNEMPQNFYKEALSLKVGEVSEPVRTEWGFHLIKLVDKKEEGKTFEDILPQLRKDVEWEKIREYQENWEKSLFDQAEIWIDQGLLKEFELDKPEG